MPITKSAKKSLRVSIAKRKDNLKTIDKFKLVLRKAKKTTDSKEQEKMLPGVYSAIDKAVKKNIIHKNKAARLKSQISSRFRLVLPDNVAPADKVKKSKTKAAKPKKKSVKKK